MPCVQSCIAVCACVGASEDEREHGPTPSLRMLAGIWEVIRCLSLCGDVVVKVVLLPLQLSDLA